METSGETCTLAGLQRSIPLRFIAHTLEDHDPVDWESMGEHESRVADLCMAFLGQIDPSLQSWGDLLGRWHDLGKYSNEFQSYLHAANDLLAELPDIHRAEVSGRVDHSTAATQWAVESFGQIGKLLAYVFAGHHAGLPDWDDGRSQSGLKQRLKKAIPNWSSNAPPELVSMTRPIMPKFAKTSDPEVAAFRAAFFIRMIFSALVDADFLATESFMSPDRLEQRPTNHRSLHELSIKLDEEIADLQARADSTPVNKIRRSVANECMEKSELPPGFFSLSVPTGGGKTIASLRFALHHAVKHDLVRVIFGVPFTSIIEQNAKVYQDMFSGLGENVVLEHHSNLDPETETTTNRLQAENWDAPIVVTTNVQLFESLFACRTSRCRKLHRIANSIIVLDEAQTLPIELLKPTMFVLRELVESYGCTVVLCTATQPALDWRSDFDIGLKNIRPIIDKPAELHASLRRTQVKRVGKIDDEELADQLADLDQVLCIVNARPHASKLFDHLGDTVGCFHLSTRMCAAHRLDCLTTIRRRLKNKQVCRVISTQLIEAGVDVDFPNVYRASCGLDSLAQAAGRCNREGLLESGQVVWFEATALPPPGFLRQSADSAAELLNEYDDLLSPEAIEKYFRLHYWKKSSTWDQLNVLGAIGKQPNDLQFNFREVADRYRFIRDDSESILVPYQTENDQVSGKVLVDQLKDPYASIDRNTWRRLQRYAVQVRQHEFAKLAAASAVEKHHERWVLIQPHLYDTKLGLRMEQADGVLPVEDLMC